MVTPKAASAAAFTSMSRTFSNTGSGVPVSSVARSMSTWLWFVGHTMRLRESTKEYEL